MTPSTTRRRLLASAGTAGLGAIAGCLFDDREERATVSRQFDADDVAALAVDSETGSVAVRSHDGDAIRVQADKRAGSDDGIDALSLTSRDDGDRLVLEATRDSDPEPFGWAETPSLHLEVEVPEGVALERATTVAGDLEVVGVAGPIEVGDAAGPIGGGGAVEQIEDRGVAGRIEASTERGDVYVGAVDGAVDARSTAGDVTVRDATGPIAARTETGDVTVDGVIETLRSEAGEITATIRGLGEDPAIRGGAADVSLALPADLDVTVEADVDLSDVDVHGEGIETAVAEAADSVRVVVGDGERRLVVETRTGAVSVTTVGGRRPPPAPARKL